MAKKEKEIVKSLAECSQEWGKRFRVGDKVEKLAVNSDDYGFIGIIRAKEVSPGGYHFAWVAWVENKVKPEHYNCIERVKQ